MTRARSTPWAPAARGERSDGPPDPASLTVSWTGTQGATRFPPWLPGCNVLHVVPKRALSVGRRVTVRCRRTPDAPALTAAGCRPSPVASSARAEEAAALEVHPIVHLAWSYAVVDPSRARRWSPTRCSTARPALANAGGGAALDVETTHGDTSGAGRCTRTGADVDVGARGVAGRTRRVAEGDPLLLRRRRVRSPRERP